MVLLGPFFVPTKGQPTGCANNPIRSPFANSKQAAVVAPTVSCVSWNLLQQKAQQGRALGREAWFCKLPHLSTFLYVACMLGLSKFGCAPVSRLGIHPYRAITHIAMPKIKHATSLNRGQLARLIQITQATSRYTERDVLCLLLGHRAGMRVTEISRITIADVMLASGKLRTELSLREAVTKGCKQRSAFLSSKDLVAALEAYLAYRIEHDIGMELNGYTYRGLLPHQPLVYSSRGCGLSQNTKRRTLETGEQKNYKACDSLQSHLTRLYKKAGVAGGSSHSGRRTFASRVLEKTGDMETVAQLLGHESIDVSMRYVDVRESTLREMFENAV